MVDIFPSCDNLGARRLGMPSRYLKKARIGENPLRNRSIGPDFRMPVNLQRVLSTYLEDFMGMMEASGLQAQDSSNSGITSYRAIHWHPPLLTLPSDDDYPLQCSPAESKCRCFLLFKLPPLS